MGIAVTAVDCDGAAPCTVEDTENLTYSLSGTDASSFTIVRGSGQIQVARGVKLDYETKQTYTVTVTATDPSDKSDSITVTITVTGRERAADAVQEGPGDIGQVERRPPGE